MTATQLSATPLKSEKGVKHQIKKLLTAHGWFYWMPAANGYGMQGVSDFCAIKDGVFLTIEAKFGYNKPTATQILFAKSIIANSAFAFCVNEKSLPFLRDWLDSFAVAQQCQMQGQEVPPEHGSRMLNAISVMMDPFAS